MIQECMLTWRYIQTESNLIMPWYSKACLDWLVKQDVKNWDVFEYGCGYSTVWWRANCKQLTSVENIESWSIAMGSVHLQDKREYTEFASMVSDGDLFDCIVVDGEWRDECVAFARDYVKPGGYMIVDNYDQEGEEFPKVEKIDPLLEGWGKQVFRQYNHSSWATAVFQKP